MRHTHKDSLKLHVPHLAQGAKTDDPPPLCSYSPFPMLFDQLLTLQAQFTQKGEATLTKHDKFGSLDCYLPVGITQCVQGVFTTIHSRRYHGDLKAMVQNYGN